jgi:hypothetical protein
VGLDEAWAWFFCTHLPPIAWTQRFSTPIHRHQCGRTVTGLWVDFWGEEGRLGPLACYLAGIQSLELRGCSSGTCLGVASQEWEQAR